MSTAVDIAKTWIGTPYIHQASVKSVGCDCLGLIRGVWRELYGAEPAQVPPYSFDWDEASGEEQLWAAAERHLHRTTAPLSKGQVVLFRMRQGAVAKHLGLISAAGDAPRFIHAYTGHGVIESALSRPWARRVVARFEFGKA